MKVWVVLSHPTDDVNRASVVGVFAKEADALALIAWHEQRVKARKNSAWRHWTYDVVEYEVQK